MITIKLNILSQISFKKVCIKIITTFVVRAISKICTALDIQMYVLSKLYTQNGHEVLTILSAIS